MLAVLAHQRNGPGQRLRASGHPHRHRRRRDTRAVALVQPDQFVPAVGCAAGLDLKQAQYPDHDVVIDLHPLAPLVAVGGGNAVCPGQPAQVISHHDNTYTRAGDFQQWPAAG